MTSIHIGRNIAELRKSIGITQETLADAVGVTPQAVSKWEVGGSPDVDLLLPIADYFGVPIDRLFGRVGNCTRVETAVAKQIAQAGQDTALSQAFELCWAMQRGIAGATELEPYTTLDVILQKETGNIHSQMLFNSGITLMALQKNLQYFFIMPEPDCGWILELGNQTDYCSFFGILSDSEILKTLYMLYSRENKPFTPKLLEKELGVTFERGTHILETLEGYSLTTASEIELDDTVQKVYRFNPNPAFIAVLALCKEILNKPNRYYFYSSNRISPYF